MIQKKYLQNAIVGGVAVLFGGTRLIPNPNTDGPATTTAIAIMGTHLTGDEEPLPVTPSPSLSPGQGQAIFRISGTTVEFRLIASNIHNVIMKAKTVFSAPSTKRDSPRVVTTHRAEGPGISIAMG